MPQYKRALPIDSEKAIEKSAAQLVLLGNVSEF